MRAFVAIELPAPVRDAVADVMGELRRAQADVAWVRPENLHVTMRFLGEMTDEQRQMLADVLARIAGNFQPIPIALSGLGAFPSISAPRVVWVGISQGQDPLVQLAGQLEDAVVALGMPRDTRRFTAHVTLGRVRTPRHRAQLVASLRDLTWTPPGPFIADHLTLFQSQLTSSGAIYTPVFTAPFSLPAPRPNA